MQSSRLVRGLFATLVIAAASPAVAQTISFPGPNTPVGPATFNNLITGQVRLDYSFIQVGDVLEISSPADVVITDFSLSAGGVFGTLPSCDHAANWSSACTFTASSNSIGAAVGYLVVTFAVRNGGLNNGPNNVEFRSTLTRGNGTAQASGTVVVTTGPLLEIRYPNAARSWQGVHNGVPGQFFERPVQVREYGSGHVAPNETTLSLTLGSAVTLISASSATGWTITASPTAAYQAQLGVQDDLSLMNDGPPFAVASLPSIGSDTIWITYLTFVACSAQTEVGFLLTASAPGATSVSSASDLSAAGACEASLEKNAYSASTSPGGQILWYTDISGTLAVDEESDLIPPTNVVLVDRLPPGFPFTSATISPPNSDFQLYVCNLPSITGVFGYQQFAAARTANQCRLYPTPGITPLSDITHVVAFAEEWLNQITAANTEVVYDGLASVRLNVYTAILSTAATGPVYNYACQQEDTDSPTLPWSEPTPSTTPPELCDSAVANVSNNARPWVDIASLDNPVQFSPGEYTDFYVRFGSLAAPLQFGEGDGLTVALPPGFIILAAGFTSNSCGAGNFEADPVDPSTNSVTFAPVGSFSLTACGSVTNDTLATHFAFYVTAQLDPTFGFTSGPLPPNNTVGPSHNPWLSLPAEQPMAILDVSNTDFVAATSQSPGFTGYPSNAAPLQSYGSTIYDQLGANIIAPSELEVALTTVDCANSVLHVQATARNNGGDTLTNVDLFVPTPAGLTLVGATATGCSIAPLPAPATTATVLTLLAYAECTLELTYGITGAALFPLIASANATATAFEVSFDGKLDTATCSSLVTLTKSFGTAGPMSDVDFTLNGDRASLQTTDAAGHIVWSIDPGSYTISEVYTSLPQGQGVWSVLLDQTINAANGVPVAVAFVNTCACNECNECQIDGSCIANGADGCCESDLDCRSLVDLCTDATCNTATGMCESVAFTPQDPPAECKDGTVFAIPIESATGPTLYVLCRIVPPSTPRNATLNYTIICGQSPLTAQQIDAGVYDGFAEECVGTP